jgi:hypothetical protein
MTETAEVSERTGLVTVVTLLRARVPDAVPTVTFTKGSGRYRVEFAYHARTVELLKSAVPAAVRRFVKAGGYWAVSADWAGPLACALLNAGVEVSGLDEVTEWVLSPTPVGERGHRAYVKGFCATCTQQPHRPGGTECDGCYRNRVARQYRVAGVLAAAGVTPWPEAVPSAGSATRCRMPLWADADGVGIPDKPDYTTAVDAVILAARGLCYPACPVCGRRPTKGAVVHIACRRRLLALLADRPFTRPRNAAFQAGLCTVCLARPHRPPGRITCQHCDGLARQIEDRSAQGDNPT